MRRETVLKAIFALGALGVGGLSLLPQAALPETGAFDKLEHLLAYGVLSLIGYKAYPGHVWRTMIGLILYGITLEGLQSLIPGRVPSLADIVANALGVGLGYLSWRLSRKGRA